jgi:hypothetical protein
VYDRLRPCIALQRQEEERGRKAREEKDKHLYTVIKAARAQDLHDQIGNTLFWDIVDFEQVRSWHGGTASCRGFWGHLTTTLISLVSTLPSRASGAWRL